MQSESVGNPPRDPWTTRMFAWAPGPLWLHHFLFWQLGLLVLIILQRLTTGEMSNLPIAFAVTFVGFIMTYVPSHVAEQIRRLQASWALSPLSKKMEVDWLESGWKLLQFRANLPGVLVMVPIIGYFYWWTNLFNAPEPWFGSQIATMYWTGFWTLVMFSGGWCTGMVLKVVRLPGLLTFDEENPPGPWEHHMQPLRFLSTIFFTIAVFGAIIIACILVIITYFPLPINSVILALAGLCGVIDLIAFVVPQWGVHKVLLSYRNYHLFELAPNLAEAMERVSEDPSQDNLSHFDKMAAMQERVQNLDVWPFNMQQLSTVIASVVVPAVVFVFQMLFSGDA